MLDPKFHPLNGKYRHATVIASQPSSSCASLWWVEARLQRLTQLQSCSGTSGPVRKCSIDTQTRCQHLRTLGPGYIEMLMSSSLENDGWVSLASHSRLKRASRDYGKQRPGRRRRPGMLPPRNLYPTKRFYGRLTGSCYLQKATIGRNSSVSGGYATHCLRRIRGQLSGCVLGGRGWVTDPHTHST